jgi:hypothetical protein
MTVPPRPNLFTAGVSKSGTTSLHYYLGQHPQVFMSPIKEPAFFAAADLLELGDRERVLAVVEQDRSALQTYLAGPQEPVMFRFVLDWDDYARLFRDARDETVIGESSTAYFWAPSAAGAIRARVPDARVVFLLRDPAQRLHTLYLQSLWRRPGVSFRAWFEAARDAPRHWPSGVGAGRYATHLGRYFDVFPRERLRVYLYEDYCADARAVLRDLFAFLHVQPDHPVDVTRRHNETFVPRFPRLHALRRRLLPGVVRPRWLPEAARRALRRAYRRRPGGHALTPADRAMVVDYYRDEIRRAADLIGRDLSAWLA